MVSLLLFHFIVVSEWPWMMMMFSETVMSNQSTKWPDCEHKTSLQQHWGLAVRSEQLQVWRYAFLFFTLLHKKKILEFILLEDQRVHSGIYMCVCVYIYIYMYIYLCGYIHSLFYSDNNIWSNMVLVNLEKSFSLSSGVNKMASSNYNIRAILSMLTIYSWSVIVLWGW